MLSVIAFAICGWVIGTLLWSALISVLSAAGRPLVQGWSSYWLAWLALALIPPLGAPLLAYAPAPLASAQLDAALALVRWTAPLQQEAVSSAGLQALALGVVLVFATGLGLRAWAIGRALVRAADVLRTAAPAAWGGAPPGPRLLVSEADTPIFCVGGGLPAIVLPRRALRMSPIQVSLVIAHEMAHLRRGDPTLFILLACVDALFWFSPFVRQLTNETRLAAEIACDALALQDGAVDRRTYARILVEAFDEHRDRDAEALAGFGGAASPRIRLARILDGAVAVRALRLSALMVAAAIVFGLGGGALIATTARMATVGDAGFAAALDARLARLYSAPACRPERAQSQ